MEAAPRRVVVYTVVKAASMFLHQLTTEISRRLRVPYYSINDPALFPELKATSWKQFIERREGPAYFGPIRVGGMEPSIPERFETYSAVVQVRDPRDVMTSLFYSQVYSHPAVPGVFEPTDDERVHWRERGIDEFVLSRIPQFRLRYDMLCTLFGKPDIVSLRYEDMIDDYGTWLKGFLSAFYPSDPPPTKRRSIFSRDTSYEAMYDRLFRKHEDDFTVGGEDVARHKRQVTPGDHARKLKPETIQVLNGELADMLHRLGYSDDEDRA